MNATITHKKIGSNVGIFFICTLSAVLLGFFSGFFSDAFSAYSLFDIAINRWIMAIIYAVFFLLLGLNLHMILTSIALSRFHYTLRKWALFLWLIQFALFVISPFLPPIMRFIFLSVAASIIAAQIVLCFRLRFFSALTLLPVLALAFFAIYAAVYLI